jgi:Fe(3+) dicitrate transport protein
VSVSPTVRVAGDLDPSVSYQYEIGLRGNPVPFAWWDTSFFYFEIEDQIGTVQLTDETSEIRNVGKARHYGWEVAAEVGTVGFWDHVHGTDFAPRFGDLSLFGNLTLLDAEFTDGPSEDKTPAYAPDYLVRAGFQYAYPGIVKLSMLTTASSQFFANDNNTEDFDVPAYEVWDLTMEANVWRETVALHVGVNNVFDTDYFSRVRSDGIDPAYGRFYYGGIKVYF